MIRLPKKEVGYTTSHTGRYWEINNHGGMEPVWYIEADATEDKGFVFLHEKDLVEMLALMREFKGDLE